MNVNFSLQQLSDIAHQIIQISTEKTFLFYGSMGVGKTTLIKEIVKQLGVNDVVSSPTFSLVNEYETLQGDLVYHFDFYRIDSDEEALDIGIEDYFNDNNWCLVEWPEKVKNLLPLDAVEIHLSLNNDGTRNIRIK